MLGSFSYQLPSALADGVCQKKFWALAQLKTGWAKARKVFFGLYPLAEANGNLKTQNFLSTQ